MSVQPRLLNPTKIEIEQIDNSKTQFDNLRREPVRVIKRNPKFKIDAQVKWNKDMALPIAGQAGTDEKENGYVILLLKDLKAANKTIKRGDRIVSMGGLAINLYVLRTEPTSHYNGEFTLLRVIFEDKSGKDDPG